MKEYLYSKKGIYYRKNDFLHNRETLVFIHGLSGSSSAWTRYEKRFEENYNILTFDLRGHGKSTKPRHYKDYEINCFGRDLAELLEYLKIETFIMISHSFASLIALEFLKNHMTMVKKAVFLSPSYNEKDRLIGKILDPLLFLTKALEALPFSGKNGRHVDYSNYPNSGDWNIPRMVADMGNTDLRVYLYCLSHSLHVNYIDLLSSIKIPTLLIHGKKDSIFPFKNSITMNNILRDSKLVLLPEANHIVVLNWFNEVSDAIANFIRAK